MGRLADFEKTYLGKLKEVGYENFVETGCYLGNGLRVAKKYFNNLFTCDISMPYVAECRRNYPEAVVHYGQSSEFLQFICPRIKGRTVFWLDAHFPNQYDAKLQDTEFNKFPVDKELRIIKSMKEGFENDVIICDDMRVVQSEDNPVRGIVGEHNLRKYHLVRNRRLHDYTGMFAITHECSFVGVDSLVLTPISLKGVIS